MPLAFADDIYLLRRRRVFTQRTYSRVRCFYWEVRLSSFPKALPSFRRKSSDLSRIRHQTDLLKRCFPVWFSLKQILFIPFGDIFLIKIPTCDRARMNPDWRVNHFQSRLYGIAIKWWNDNYWSPPSFIQFYSSQPVTFPHFPSWMPPSCLWLCVRKR